jgi:diguanylate cyclase (GGDEF)-like protein
MTLTTAPEAVLPKPAPAKPACAGPGRGGAAKNPKNRAAPPQAPAESLALPDLAARVDALLRAPGWRLDMPADIRRLYRDKVRPSWRQGSARWCLIIAGLNALNMGFDVAVFPGAVLPTVLTLRAAVSGSLLLAAWLIWRGRTAEQEWLMLLAPCVLGIGFAGKAGLLSGNSLLLCRYINDAFTICASAILFTGLSVRQCAGLGAVALLLIGVFLLQSGLPDIDRLQMMVFDASVTGAMIWGRHSQRRVMVRMFLLNLREELRGNEAAIRNAQLSSIAYIDKLTGVHNRRYFEEICAAMSESTKNLLPLSLCYIDLDHFKKLNDQRGHLQGDHCLRLAAACMRQNQRGKTDILARFGGEEFVLLLPGAGHAVALEVAERIRAAIAALEQPHPGSPFGVVTASIGVATIAAAPMAIETLIRQADGALYRAKSGGRNQVSG